jgi:hypothetical protein
MATLVRDGQRTWSGTRDEEGHREYSITHLVKADPTDGPSNVMVTAGLPLPGSVWSFDADLDVWAFCHPNMDVVPSQEKLGDPGYWWDVKQKFSTKPMKRCNMTTIEDPLMEPQKVSGSFCRYTKEAIIDRLGRSLRNSSHEMFHGPQVEFDDDRPCVRIEQNVLNLDLPLLTQLRNTLNDAPLWGLSERMIKFRPATWERKLYGTCTFYYTRVLEFDINFDTFDKKIVDRGTRCLLGHWGAGTGAGCTVDITTNAQGEITNAVLNTGGGGYAENGIIQLTVASPGTGGVVNCQTSSTGVVTLVINVGYHGSGYPASATTTAVATVSGSRWIVDKIDGSPPSINNPQHFMQYKDVNGENTKTMLNGGGAPLREGDLPVYFPLEYYFSSNFLLLGVPLSL